MFWSHKPAAVLHTMNVCGIACTQRNATVWHLFISNLNCLWGALLSCWLIFHCIVSKTLDSQMTSINADLCLWSYKLKTHWINIHEISLPVWHTIIHFFQLWFLFHLSSLSLFLFSLWCTYLFRNYLPSSCPSPPSLSLFPAGWCVDLYGVNGPFSWSSLSFSVRQT